MIITCPPLPLSPALTPSTAALWLHPTSSPTPPGLSEHHRFRILPAWPSPVAHGAPVLHAIQPSIMMNQDETQRKFCPLHLLQMTYQGYDWLGSLSITSCGSRNPAPSLPVTAHTRRPSSGRGPVANSVCASQRAPEPDVLCPIKEGKRSKRSESSVVVSGCYRNHFFSKKSLRMCLPSMHVVP